MEVSAYLDTQGRKGMYELPRIDLWYVCLGLNLDYAAFQSISVQANISVETFEQMLIGDVPVSLETANSVLAALSNICGYTLTLKTVRVVLLETR